MWIAAALITIGGDAAPQERQGPAATFFEPLHVPLVSVDVVALDTKGRPVPGLTAEDFEVREDGAVVEISHFYAAPGVVRQPSEEPPSDPTARPAVPDQDLYLAIYVDDTSIGPQRRRATLGHVQAFFSQPFPPRVKAMLARYDGALDIKSDFTDDTDRLYELTTEIQQKSPVNFNREPDMLIREMQSVASASRQHEAAAASSGGFSQSQEAGARMAEDFLPQIDALARAMHSRHLESLEALAAFVRYLSGIQGRKAVLWVGGGLESRVGENLYSTWTQVFPEQARKESINPITESRRYDTTRYIRELVEFANSNRVAFYAVSPLAHSTTVAISAEVRDPSISGSPGYGNIMAEEEALGLMTSPTGGRVLADNQGLDDQLTGVSEELGSYYSLGYRPPSPGDGSYHSIEVACRREGVKLRHRRGYQDTPPKEQMDNRTLAAAVLGVAENPMNIALETGPQEDRGDGKFLVPVLVRIPIAQLVLLPAGESHLGQVTVSTAVRDLQGRMSSVSGRQFPLEIPNDQLLAAVQQQAGFTVGLVMRKGEQRIAVSVRDDKSLIESTAFMDVDVGGGIGDTTS